MKSILKNMSVVLSTAVLFSCVAGIPVLAEETIPTIPMSTQTMETRDETKESSSLDSEDFYIYSMDDLVSALGEENVLVTSETDIKLVRNIARMEGNDQIIIFTGGTYHVDFNGCMYEGFVTFQIAGGDVTLSDSSSGQTGGIATKAHVYDDYMSGYPAIGHDGGQLTIKSGRYVSGFCGISSSSGTLLIEDGNFIGTDECGFGTGAEMYTGANVTITGGNFQGTGGGLFANSCDFYDDGRILNLQISGGFFESTASDNTFSAILYEDDRIDRDLDIHSLLAPGFVFSPDIIYEDSDENYTYAYTAKTVCVAPEGEAEDGVESFVERLYSQVLGRKADPAGFSDWVARLKSKKITGSEAAFGFFFSPELTNRKLTNEQFITLLYNVFFDRAPDAGGMKNWLEALDTGASRKYIFAGFANSQEWKGLCEKYSIEPGSYASDEPRDQNLKVTAFVQRLYSLCLNRQADTEGLNHWTATLNCQMQDGAQTAHGFFFSQEFKKRNLSDEEFVEVLYKVMLGRGSDPAGKAGWVKQLKAGTDRLDVFRGFVYSQEFDQICADYGIVRGTI